MGNPYAKMGRRAPDTRPRALEGCQVPDENRLGGRGDGFRQFMLILESGRVAIAALSVGLAQAAYDEALRYARERQQFAKPISSFQPIEFKLAEMPIEFELPPPLVYKPTFV